MGERQRQERSPRALNLAGQASLHRQTKVQRPMQQTAVRQEQTGQRQAQTHMPRSPWILLLLNPRAGILTSIHYILRVSSTRTHTHKHKTHTHTHTQDTILVCGKGRWHLMG